MLRAPIWRLRFRLALLAGAGIVGAHYLGYLAAAPHDHSRAALLASSGHGSESAFVTFGLALFAAAVVFMVQGLIDSSTRTRLGSAAAGVPTFIALAIAQSTGFVLLESIERLNAGMSLAHLATETPFLLGVCLQLVLAAAGALLVVLLARAVEGVVRLLGRSFGREADEVLGRVVDVCSPKVRVVGEAWNVRGPPALLSQTC